jgi:hypothetical protein
MANKASEPIRVGYIKRLRLFRQPRTGPSLPVDDVFTSSYQQYSRKRKAYKCFNPRINKIMENINVMIDETYVRKSKEGNTYSEVQDDEEDMKEEEVEGEAEEEKHPGTEQEEYE